MKLLDQLDSYYSDLDAEQGLISPEEIAAMVGRVRELPVNLHPTEQRSRVAVAAVAAIVAFLGIGGAVIALRLVSDGPPVATTQPEPAVTTAAPEPPVTTPAPESTFSFEIVEDFPGTGGSLYGPDIVAGGPGFVAVGAVGDPSVPTRSGHTRTFAAVWTSADGTDWEPVPHDAAIFGGEVDHRMEGVTVGGPGLVAVGGGEGAAVWTSVDGFTWERVPHDEAVFGSGDWMASVTAGGPGLVAVGRDGGRGVVWTSVDGSVWTRVPDDDSVFEAGSWLWDVASAGPGLVAVGRSGDSRPAIWTSVDGLSWSRVPHDESLFASGGWISGVVAGGPGVVAVGSAVEGSEVAAVWTSANGIDWVRVPHDPATFDGEGPQTEMYDIASSDQGLVAVGWEQGGTRAPVWNSTDGVTWTRTDSVQGHQSFLGAVAAGDDAIVAVGVGNAIIANLDE